MLPTDRLLGRALTAAMALLVLGFGATACSAGASTASGVATTQGPKPKVTVAGDSISIGLGAELRKAAGPDLDVKVIGEEGTGLARPDRFDWPARLTKLAKEFPPKVLVLSLSSNDAQDLTDATGKVVVPFADTARWDAEYSRRLAAGFDAFSGGDTTVVWVGHVRTADERTGTTNRRIQQLAVATAASRPWVKVADLGALLGTGEQKATDCLMPDGLHLTVACLDTAAGKLEALLPTN